jgi:type I restriction enzyme S subunit
MKKGWNRKRLGDVLEVQNGFAFDSTRFNPSKGPPLIRIRSLKLGIETETRYGGEYEDKYMVRVGDLLIGMDGEFGCYEWKGEPSLLNQRVCRLQGFSGDLLPRFLFYGVNDYLKAIEDVTGFATVKHLSSKQILAIEFPVPPLAEQRRIVGVLDEAFASLATAQAHAAQNLQNARALFESHLNAVFTQRGVGWKQTTLGEEIDLLSGFAFKSSQYTTNEKDIRLLRGDNIIQGCLRWDDVKRWPANDTKEYRRYWLSEGDVVLAMDRPWVKAGMKYAMMTSNDLPCLLVQRTARLRGGENLDNRFLMRLIGSAAFTSHILGVQTGIGVPHISGQQIKDFGFSCPSVAEQRRIADNLDALAAEIQRLTRIYEQKLAALAELKKSLLHQAFSGEI